MNGHNAGVPTSAPATEPVWDGPVARWIGHPSPTPWIGKIEALPGYVYYLTPIRRPLEPDHAEIGPLCYRCFPDVFYEHWQNRDRWEEVEPDTPLKHLHDCMRCDRVIGPA